MIVPVMYCHCYEPLQFPFFFLPGLHSLFKLGILCILSKLALDCECSLLLLSFSLDFCCGFCHMLVPGLMHLPSLSLVSMVNWCMYPKRIIIIKKPLQSRCLFFNFVLATTAYKYSKEFNILFDCVRFFFRFYSPLFSASLVWGSSGMSNLNN